ncbi:MAG: mitochondrial fission ELM1 family protein [Pseudomonadota bacterium]
MSDNPAPSNTQTPEVFPPYWVITDGTPGMENQCLGLADALGVVPHVLRVVLPFPWSLVAPYGSARQALASVNIHPPWPDLLIASGRRSVPIARSIRQLSAGKTKLVYIQDPGRGHKDFSLIICPSHDDISGTNTLKTTGALHRCTPERLKQGFAELNLGAPPPGGFGAVLIGGPNKVYNYDRDFIAGLAQQLADVGLSLLITASHRTPPELDEMIKKLIPTRMFWSPRQEDGVRNPYFGFLEAASHIFVTADSINMVSEAASTGKPIYILNPPMRWGVDSENKFSRFHMHLKTLGITRSMTVPIDTWKYSPLLDMQRAAAAVRKVVPNLPPPRSKPSPEPSPEPPSASSPEPPSAPSPTPSG